MSTYSLILLLSTISASPVSTNPNGELLEFTATWCGPCQMQVPILEELAESIKGRVKIAKLNVDEAGGVAGQFGVQAIPTLLLFKDGNEARRFIGVQSKETLIDAISSAL